MDSLDLAKLIATARKLTKFKDKDFVKRLLDASNQPVLDMGKGHYATHAMSSADNLAYPTVVRLSGEPNLTRLDRDEAYDYATSSGEYLSFRSPEEADSFARKYKKLLWGMK